jgi:hypothetical protein
LSRRQALGRVLGARFRPDEERVIAEAIGRSGKTQADWIREALLRASGRGAKNAGVRSAAKPRCSSGSSNGSAAI